MSVRNIEGSGPLFVADDGQAIRSRSLMGAECLEVTSESTAAKVLLPLARAYVRRITRDEFMVRLPSRVWRAMDENSAVKEIGAEHITEARLCWPEKQQSAKYQHHHSVSVSNNIARLMLRKMREQPDFSDELHESARMRLFYRDGFYDFSAGRFETCESDDTVTALRIPVAFPAHPGPEAMREFTERVLQPILPIKCERDALLAYIARGLAGLVEEKRWAVFIGDRNTGKSLLTDALKATFPCAVCDFDGSHLMDSTDTEPARAFAFAMGTLEHAGMGVCNELPVRGNLDGNKLKKLASGGDAITARQLYSEGRSFVPRARLLLCANKLPQLNPDDACKTMLWFCARTEFVGSQLTPEQTAANEEFEKDPFNVGLRYAVGDVGIKQYVKSQAAKAALTHLILEHFTQDASYPPPSVRQYTPDGDLPVEQVIARFVVATGCKKDFVSEEIIKREVRARTRQSVERSVITSALQRLSKSAGMASHEQASWTQRGSPGGRVGGWRFVRERSLTLS